MLKFRDLRAEEVEVRVQSIKENGLVLLLYKDARCDQNILDETVGALNWQRSHCRDNANCIVSIWDESKKQWVSKEDTGTESNTEAQKGLASDSFKRACFNWGIGRELYTAPFTWIPASKCNITKQGIKNVCYDTFRVKEMEVKNKRITKLIITNNETNIIVFEWSDNSRSAEVTRSADPSQPAQYDPRITQAHYNSLIKQAQIAHVSTAAVLKKFGCEKPSMMTISQYKQAMNMLGGNDE